MSLFSSFLIVIRFCADLLRATVDLSGGFAKLFLAHLPERPRLFTEFLLPRWSMGECDEITARVLPEIRYLGQGLASLEVRVDPLSGESRQIN